MGAEFSPRCSAGFDELSLNGVGIDPFGRSPSKPVYRHGAIVPGYTVTTRHALAVAPALRFLYSG